MKTKNIGLFPEPSVHPAKASPVKIDKRPWEREWKIQEQIKESTNQKKSKQKNSAVPLS